MTDKKIFYLVCIDKKSQLGVFYDLLLRFNIKNKELTPEELELLKELIKRNLKEHDNYLMPEFKKALLKKLELIK